MKSSYVLPGESHIRHFAVGYDVITGPTHYFCRVKQWHMSSSAAGKHLELIIQSTGLTPQAVAKTLKLLDEGATIPFIARYRKEMTGGMDEVMIGEVFKMQKRLAELENRKQTILDAISEQGKLTEELRLRITDCYDSNELEDIYLPYKKRKKTRADLAREQGLEPLAKIIMSQRNQDIDHIASKYITDVVTNEDMAINGACDIIAEWVSEDQEVRDRLRIQFRKFAVIRSKVVAKKKEEAAKYQDYFDFAEPLARCPSHRFLAMMRGEAEGLLKTSLELDNERAVSMISRKYIRSQNCTEAPLIADAVEDSYKRLIFPAVETQIINEFREKADDEAIKVFGENLRQLLLAAPLGQRAVMAIDPGFRTGCKVVCLDANGDLLHYTTIFPHAPQNQWQEAIAAIRHLADKYGVQAIAIGNGTASRETKTLVDEIKFEARVEVFVVSESGASIYSASEVAREEFPDLDVTVRGAVSIGRRLMDPLAELVKIDPKSIGVGQYQHDVHQGKLRENLDMTVVSCVNRVGININTASRHILTYVAGLGPSLAKNIVEFRKANGDFNVVSQLRSVPRLGDKAFEQCAGFIRIRDGSQPLDNTGVHPESYHVVEKMAQSLGVTISDFIADSSLRKQIRPENFITEKTGLPTITDILRELEKPGLDPRGEARAFSFDENIRTINDVREGMIVPGIVTNLTNFGAFVDIGVKQDGLLHISQITTKYIQNPGDVLHLGQEVKVCVTGVDVHRKRINLTMIF